MCDLSGDICVLFARMNNNIICISVDGLNVHCINCAHTAKSAAVSFFVPIRNLSMHRC